jgi:type I restriction enzyme S subunit
VLDWFLNTKIQVPDVERQIQIAGYLSELEHQLTIQKRLAATLKKQKRGLMQQLLTGKLRVPEKV